MPSLIDHLEREHAREPCFAKSLPVKVQKERRLRRCRLLTDFSPLTVPEDPLACLLFTLREANEELPLKRDQYLRGRLLRNALHDLVVGIYAPAIKVCEDRALPPTHFRNCIFVQVGASSVVDANHHIGWPDRLREARL